MTLAGILSRLEAADLADGIPKDFDIFIQKLVQDISPRFRVFGPHQFQFIRDRH